MKSLRWEYRRRLLITFLFFVSCAIIVGILSLIPSYILSETQSAQASKITADLQKSRQASGMDQVEKDLAQSQAIINELKGNESKFSFFDSIQDVVKYHSPLIAINSFNFSSDIISPTTTISHIVIQGNAVTRDALIGLQKNLEQDNNFSKVELPISDFAKSSDIGFSIRLTLH